MNALTATTEARRDLMARAQAEHFARLRAYIGGTIRKICDQHSSSLQAADRADIISEAVARVLAKMQLHEWPTAKPLVSRIARFALADHWRETSKRIDLEALQGDEAAQVIDPAEAAEEEADAERHWREFRKQLAQYSNKTGIPSAALVGFISSETDSEIAHRCKVKRRTVQAWRLRCNIKKV